MEIARDSVSGMGDSSAFDRIEGAAAAGILDGLSSSSSQSQDSKQALSM